MLDQAHRLRQPIGVFLTSADEMYGPVTTLRRNNRVVKHIPWTAFRLSDVDWIRVIDARDILGVSFPCSLFGPRPSDGSYRIRTSSRNISPPTNNPPFGAHSLLLKSCNQHGRSSTTHPSTLSTKMRFLMDWQSFASIIRDWMRSPVLY